MTSKDDFIGRWSPLICSKNYGKHMLESSLADWVEVMALAGDATWPWSDIADFLDDVGIEDLASRQPAFTGGAGYLAAFGESTDNVAGEDGELLDEKVVERVRKTLEERAFYLGASYPFEFDAFDRLVTRERWCGTGSAYLALLEICAVKGWVPQDADRSLQREASNLFEQLVNLAWRKAGLSSAVTGTSGGSGRFEERLIRAAIDLGLRAYPDRERHSFYAKDDGVDVVSGLFWQDGRQGELLFLSQATNAQQGEWRKKLTDIPIARWAGYFGEDLQPVGYLAVPYHMTQDAFDDVFKCEPDKSFLDRLRLVKMFGGNLDEPSAEIGKMLDCVHDAFERRIR